MSEKEKKAKAKKVFEELITLYNVADELENNGEDEQANKVRTTLNNATAFIVESFNL